MLNTGQLAPLSSRSSPGRHASPPSYLTGVPVSYSPLHGPDSGITMLTTRSHSTGGLSLPLILFSGVRSPSPYKTTSASSSFNTATTTPHEQPTVPILSVICGCSIKSETLT